MPYLHLVRNGKSPKLFPLHRQMTSIGTGDGCDIQLSDPLGRELHAVVFCDGRRFSIAAWDSRQPLRINGKARKRRRLVHRDVIELGASQLVFILTDERSLRASAASKSVVEAYRCLAEFSADLLCAESPSIAFARLVDAVLELTGADKGFLILCDDGVRRVAAARTARGQDLCNAESLLSDAILERALRLQRPVVVADTLRDSEWNAQPSVLRFYLTSILCVPILGEERPLGALYVGKTSIVEVFSEEGLELLTVLASQAALLLQNLFLQQRLRQERQLLVDQCEWFGSGALLGASGAMFDVFHALRALAPTDLTVLIQGGIGTGKTLVAKEIHRLSPRQHGPLVTYRCDSAPPEQLAAQLFGDVLDSVGGGEQPSKFWEARGGTLLLEEITELPWELQYRLLQTLQHQPTDCRLLFTASRDLKALVAARRFREDLYWQIQMPTLELPPLRLRGRDDLLLARRFLAVFAERHGSPVRDFSPAAIAAIRRYSWPGNVSELEGRVLKASLVAKQPCIEPEDLGLETESLPPVVPLGEATKCFAERYVRSALTQVQGDPHRAARLLDVDVRTIQRHLGA